MIKVSVLYPKTDTSTFDINYYTTTHIPLVEASLGDVCKQVAVDQGLSGGAPGDAPTYEIMAHLYFDSLEAFQGAFGPHAKTIMADIPNFTNVQPTVQISEVIR